MPMFGNNGAVSRMMGVDPRFVREGPYSMAQQPNLGAPSPFTQPPMQTQQMPPMMQQPARLPQKPQEPVARNIFGIRQDTADRLSDFAGFALGVGGSPMGAQIMQQNAQRRQSFVDDKQQQQRLDAQQNQPVFREVNGSIVRIDPRTGQSMVVHQGQPEQTGFARELAAAGIDPASDQGRALMLSRLQNQANPYIPMRNDDGTIQLVRPPLGGVAAPQTTPPPPPQGFTIINDGGAPQGNRPFDRNRLDAVTAGVESGNRDYANGRPVTSPKGARFAMQVMPATARDPGFGLRPADPNNAADMNRLGREYRAAMQQRYGGDLARMWAAYNAGPGRVDEAIRLYGNNWLAHMPAETQGYVARTMRRAGAR